MYALETISKDVKSYATEANAVKAVVAYFGPQEADADRHCNILIVCNAAGRFVPMCINIRPGPSFSVCLNSGFFCAN